MAKWVANCQQRLRGAHTCLKITMRNFVGGLLAIIIGSTVIVVLLGIVQPTYPEPYSMIWFLLAGSDALQRTLFEHLTLMLVSLYFLSWVIIGLVIGPFSKPGWNTVRSALWVGIILALFALTSELLLHPEFWNLEINPDRNLDLIYQFASSVILSLLTLPSALSSAFVVNKLGQQSDPPIPTKIETVCECGAVFKSNPIICSECGKLLNPDRA